jgi:hypothetical protein
MDTFLKKTACLQQVMWFALTQNERLAFYPASQLLSNQIFAERVSTF